MNSKKAKALRRTARQSMPDKPEVRQPSVKLRRPEPPEKDMDDTTLPRAMKMMHTIAMAVTNKRAYIHKGNLVLFEPVPGRAWEDGEIVIQDDEAFFHDFVTGVKTKVDNDNDGLVIRIRDLL